MSRAEAEAERAVLGVDGHHGHDAETAEDLRRSFADSEQRRRDLLVDRLRELLGKPLLRRRPHQIDLGDQHVLPEEVLRRPPNERRLAEAARREDDDVLAVEDVTLEFGELGLAVGERVIEGQVAEAEGICVWGHRSEHQKAYSETYQMAYHHLAYVYFPIPVGDSPVARGG